MKSEKEGSTRRGAAAGGRAKPGGGAPREAGSGAATPKEASEGAGSSRASKIRTVKGGAGKEQGSRRPPARASRFMDLPEPVREDILEGIEGGSLTFSGAAELAESHGIRPGAAAMRGQIRAALRKRRIEEAEETLREIVSEFSDKPAEESLASLALLILRMAAVGLVEGSVGIKDIDLPKFLAVLPNHGKERARGAGQPGAGEPAGSASQGAGGLSDAAAAEIRRKILGLDE